MKYVEWLGRYFRDRPAVFDATHTHKGALTSARIWAKPRGMERISLEAELAELRQFRCRMMEHATPAMWEAMKSELGMHSITLRHPKESRDHRFRARFRTRFPKLAAIVPDRVRERLDELMDDRLDPIVFYIEELLKTILHDDAARRDTRSKIPGTADNELVMCAEALSEAYGKKVTEVYSHLSLLVDELWDNNCGRPGEVAESHARMRADRDNWRADAHMLGWCRTALLPHATPEGEAMPLEHPKTARMEFHAFHAVFTGEAMLDDHELHKELHKEFVRRVLDDPPKSG